MKNVPRFVTTLLILFGLITRCEMFWGDSDSPPPGEDAIYQINGCNGSIGLRKSAEMDSCFSYEFTNHLQVEFCVNANCCPDSNRFDFEYHIENDVIFVTVMDTAEHLCKCFCPYVIHLELNKLPLSHYYFRCSYYDKIIYYEEIQRKG